MLHGGVVPVLGEIKVAQLGWYPTWHGIPDCTVGHRGHRWKGEPHLPAKASSQAAGHLLPGPCFRTEIVA